MGSFSIWHWLIVLVIVLLVFGTKKLRNIGGDLGGAVKNFKDAMNEEKNKPTELPRQGGSAVAQVAAAEEMGAQQGLGPGVVLQHLAIPAHRHDRIGQFLDHPFVDTRHALRLA